ncbi:MAG: hypothetical protein LBE62_07780 [Azonexus sp.]|jgi:hypothetical protein|nr:hypothetical protein [Azonexus sp.]
MIGRFLHQTWRLLRWLFAALALLLCGLIAVAWWVNRHDDPPLPEITAAMRFAPPTPEAMDNNAYFTLLGLDAPPSEDAAATGQRRFAADMRAYAHYRQTGEIKPLPDDDVPASPPGMSPLRCPAEADDCYAHYLAHAPAIKDKLTEQATLIARYLSLREKPVYEEIIPPYIAQQLPPYGTAVVASELIDMRAALLLKEQRLDEALAMMEVNADIHRRLALGSRTLVGAMIALAMDLRQQRMLASALHHLPALADRHAQRLEALVKSSAPVPLTAVLEGDRKMVLAYMEDAISGKMVTLNTDAGQFEEEENPVTEWLRERWFNLLYLPNATCNSYYLSWQEPIHLSRLPPDQLAAAKAAPTPKPDEAASPGDFPFFPLRNYNGNILLSIAKPDITDFIERAHDIEGYHRLVRLQIAARREHIPFAQMPAWLAAQPPELRNPYTLQPMDWDATTQSLQFAGRQPQSQNPEPRNIYRLRLGTATD